MQAVRNRAADLVEWVLAAALILAGVIATGTAVREFRVVTAVTPVIAHESGPADIPATVPSKAVSVPLLLLGDGQEVRVGETLDAITKRLGSNADIGNETIDRTPLGQRLIRMYEHASTRFVIVFEPFGGRSEPRVAAIYLQ